MISEKYSAGGRKVRLLFLSIQSLEQQQLFVRYYPYESKDIPTYKKGEFTADGSIDCFDSIFGCIPYTD